MIPPIPPSPLIDTPPLREQRRVGTTPWVSHQPEFPHCSSDTQMVQPFGPSSCVQTLAKYVNIYSVWRLVESACGGLYKAHVEACTKRSYHLVYLLPLLLTGDGISVMLITVLPLSPTPFST